MEEVCIHRRTFNLYLCAMLLATGFSCREKISMVIPWCPVCDANGPLKMEITFMSKGGNATKYYLKTSVRSPGMRNVGGCLFIAKETGSLLKKAGNWHVHQCLNGAPKVNECWVSKSKNVMHQKHKVTNYCSQGCYGQGKSGKNEKAKKLTSPSTFSLHGRRHLMHLSSWQWNWQWARCSPGG